MRTKDILSNKSAASAHAEFLGQIFNYFIFKIIVDSTIKVIFLLVVDFLVTVIALIQSRIWLPYYKLRIMRMEFSFSGNKLSIAFLNMIGFLKRKSLSAMRLRFTFISWILFIPFAITLSNLLYNGIINRILFTRTSKLLPTELLSFLCLTKSLLNKRNEITKITKKTSEADIFFSGKWQELRGLSGELSFDANDANNYNVIYKPILEISLKNNPNNVGLRTSFIYLLYLNTNDFVGIV